MLHLSFFRMIFIILIAACIGSINAQQWQLVNTGTKINFNSAVQITDEKAFVVGDNGMLIATNNRGSTWYSIYLGESANLNSIRFKDDYNAFIAGNNGLILKTDSRWRSWSDISTRPNYHNYDVDFLNELDGVVVGYKYLYAGEHPVKFVSILVTHDGGLTWTDRSPQFQGKLNSIFCYDDKKIIAVGNSGLVAYSDDLGDNWYFQRLTRNNFNEIRVCPQGLKVAVGDYGTLFICKFRWENYSIDNKYHLNSICMKGDGSYVMAATKRNISTNDHPQQTVILQASEINGNWKEVFVSTSGIFNCINFCNTKSAIAVGNDGLVAVYRKTNQYYPYVTDELNSDVRIQNYPNPFNPTTLIKFAIPSESNVELKIFDILGNEIAVLVSENKPAGNYETEWDASALPSGVYISRLIVGNKSYLNKMLLMK